MITISVIIPFYNPGKLLCRCLDSIIGQEGAISYEVLMVDDGSTDGSASLVEKYSNPHFRLFNQQNEGPSSARNKGIAEAQGKYIAFIDADDYWEPTFFETLVGFLENHQECVAVSCGQCHLTVSGKNIAPACIGSYSQPLVLDDFFDFWSQWEHVCTGSMVARTEVVRSTGGQRGDLRITEDLEFWALIATKGKWGFVPEVLFTSDGTENIDGQEAWIKKMSVRWNNAPTIGKWEERLMAEAPQLAASRSYQNARGVISRNLTYCQLLSGRTDIARNEAIKYGGHFTLDRIGRLMNICKHTKLTWRLLSSFLRYREYHRFK